MPVKLSQISTTAVAARARMERLVSTAATVTVARVSQTTLAPRVKQVNCDTHFYHNYIRNICLIFITVYV